MELRAARFCRGSSAVNNEQVMSGVCDIAWIVCSASEVGRDGEQVVAGRKGEK